jgi:hypothetical protein
VVKTPTVVVYGNAWAVPAQKGDANEELDGHGVFFVES